jgi:hypothetical protein
MKRKMMKNHLTDIGEVILREEFAKKVKCNSDGFTISTKKGTLSSSTEDDLFWEWIDYLKSI